MVLVRLILISFTLVCMLTISNKTQPIKENIVGLNGVVKTVKLGFLVDLVLMVEHLMSISLMQILLMVVLILV